MNTHTRAISSIPDYGRTPYTTDATHATDATLTKSKKLENETCLVAALLFEISDIYLLKLMRLELISRPLIFRLSLLPAIFLPVSQEALRETFSQEPDAADSTPGTSESLRIPPFLSLIPCRSVAFMSRGYVETMASDRYRLTMAPATRVGKGFSTDFILFRVFSIGSIGQTQKARSGCRAFEKTLGK